jgi:hypothetical protein
VSSSETPSPRDAYESLGEAYQKSGEKQLAVESDKKALEKNPGNSEAKEKLAALEIAWLPCSRIFAVACKLVVLWLLQKTASADKIQATASG